MVSFSNHTEGTALSCAAANGHEMIVQYLLNNDVLTSGCYYESDLSHKSAHPLQVQLVCFA